MNSGSHALAGSPRAPAQGIREQALCFDCAGQALLGIISSPAQEVETKLGVLIIVGGPQYRAGSHRQFVLLARQLAAAGYISMRFDTRGMGDSAGAMTGFEQSAPDIEAAIDALLKSCPQLEAVVLLGLCDAASAALLYLQSSGGDSRVAGLVLMNPWLRSELSHAKTQLKHYYLHRIFDPTFWRKLLRGSVAKSAALDLWRSLSRICIKHTSQSLTFHQRMALGWAEFRGSILLLLSGDDYTAKEFIEYSSSDEQWQQAFSRRVPMRYELSGANHTFSSAEWRSWVEQSVLAWLSELASATPRTDGIDV